MPLRRPALTLVCEEESKDDDESSEEEEAAAVPVVTFAPSMGSERSEGKRVKAISPDLAGQMAAVQLEARDSYDDDSSPPGGKRGRSQLRRQDSWTVTGTNSFQQDDVKLGTGGMLDSSRRQISNVSYEDLKRERLLGKGATAKVYLCRHVPTGRVVALKELSVAADDQTRRMAVNELKMGHKHAGHADYLVQFIDAFFVEGKICIAMEFADAGSLEDVYKASIPSGGMPPDPLGAATVQMLRGLQYLHREMHQVHRDLKPANVMVTSRGVAKLSDFGISRQLESTQGVAITQVGTSMYMAPERLTGQAYSFPSDVWSIGVIVMEGLTGRHPFAAAKSFMSLHAAIMTHAAPVPPEGTPAEIAEFVALCFRKEPTGRTGRPAVRTLLSGAWLQHWQGASPEAETLEYLQQVGIV